ncbi:MAG: L,D-transpeptidase family protein, partial [Rhodospirillales bacterium]|nr:L,D-transpeptidase family protein [Rhodospirillales bacterium]
MLNRIVSIGCALLLLAPPQAAAAGFAEALARELSSGALVAEADNETAALATLTRFYADRGMRPVWVTAEAAGERAVTLAKILVAANEDALDPDDYGGAAIDALLGATRMDLLAQLEVRLSMGLMRFAADLGQGRIAPNAADPALFLFREDVDKAEVIAGAAGAVDLEAFVQRYRPQTPRYNRLKTALTRYRLIARDGGWQSVPAGPTLKPGMSESRVPLLRARLRVSGDLVPDQDAARAGGDPNLYDDALVAAVKQMQFRHGLEADGALGRRTLEALNVPVEARIEQMILNLERRRWMPDDLGRRYVFVNLADFTLKFVDGEKTVLDMRVVIGKPYHKTPVFSKDMTYLEINPYWNVPPSIASKELLPKIKKNVNYLSSNKFEVFNSWKSGAAAVDPRTVDWQRYTAADFPFKLRQGSGDGNALGRIKFMLPNHFNVYLHDTPTKALFDKAARSFSHGCIRVQHPPRLAEVVLAGNPGWSLAKIEASIESGERKVV